MYIITGRFDDYGSDYRNGLTVVYVHLGTGEVLAQAILCKGNYETRFANLIPGHEGNQMSTNELAAEENRLNQTAPQTIAAEHEKWATIAMLKQKLVEHGKNSQTSYKTGITTNALLQFIRNRMENNTLFLLFVENAEDGLPKTLLSNECEKARTENIILTDFEKRVQEESENIYSLWNEYWSNIIQQTPPFYYE